MTTGRSLRIGEAVLGGGVLALGLFIAVETLQMEVAAGLVAVSTALLREAFFGHIAHEGGFELDWRAVALVSGGLIVEMLLVERAGWIVAATILFVLTARAFRSHRLVIDLVLGVGLAALTFVVFSYGLDLTLPTGEVLEQLIAPAEGAEAMPQR
ncbi:MAG TPA: tripartite tricarboxylate transporter TctB family protein [Geminicoccaceae bacterium]|nr:tripartite tricarboxylate transporter TctB family protein [Geminicoccaceae bacterium]